MKKILLSSMFALLMGTSVMASQLITFTVSYDDFNPISHGHPKSPVAPPNVEIEDYTLSFAVNHPDYLLIIKDVDDNVVYTTTVWSTVTEVVLPSTLSGDYQIELVMGNWLFSGHISL